jgi:hypothetical protein
MTHNDLIERVARAMCQSALELHGACYDACEKAGKCCGDDMDLPAARTALAEVYTALREPTPEMLDEAQRAWTPGVSYGEAHAIRYRAMLTASPLNPEN